MNPIENFWKNSISIGIKERDTNVVEIRELEAAFNCAHNSHNKWFECLTHLQLEAAMASHASPSPTPSSFALPKEPKYDNYLYQHPDHSGRHLPSLFPWIILLGILLFLLLVTFVAWFITDRARAMSVPPPAGDLQLSTQFVLPPEEESATPSSSSSETGVFDEMMIGIGR